MAKYLDDNGLLYFWQKIKNKFAAKDQAIKNITRSGTTFTATRADDTTFTFTQQDNTVAKTTTTPKMNGTAAIGSETKYAAGDHVHPTDTSRVPTTRTVNEKALSSDITLTGEDIAVSSEESASIADYISNMELDISSKVDQVSGKGLSTNDYTTAEKNKLSGIASGAEVNQNAFSNVKVGTTTIQADGKTDTLELVAGSNVTLTPDATNDKVTIATTDNDTKNTAGSTDSSSKLFIIGATSQAANPQTYSQDTAYVGTDGHLYSDSKQVVNISGTQALTNKTYNGYTLAAASAKGVDTSIASGSTSTNLPTTAAVASYVDSAVAIASSGALTYKGVATALTDITNTAYKQGWYWMVGSNPSITIDGQACEAGDMIIAKQDKTATADNDLDAIQSNIVTITNAEIDTIVAS